MLDMSNVPGYLLILGIPLLFLEFYWPWIAGALFLLVLWKIKKTVRMKFQIAAIALVLFVIGKIVFHFFPGYIPGCNENSKKGVYRMPDYIIINQKSGRFFFPYNIPVKKPISHIFPVPVNNAAGTIDFDNAITILKFHGDTTPDYDIVAKDFLSEVNGDFEFGFCPVFNEEKIVYTQTRWAVVANIKTGKVESPILTMSLDDMIDGIIPLDTSKDLFVINKLIPASNCSSQQLNVMRLEKDNFIGMGAIDGGVDFPLKQPWIVHERKIITYDSDANKLLCHDIDLKPATHPFVDIFNRNNKKFRKLKEMIIHPTLPFGLVVEIGKDLDWNTINDMPLNEETDQIKRALYKQQEIHVLYLLRWDTPDTNKQYIPIHTNAFSLLPPLAVEQYSRFTFSPDGKWLVFGHEDMSKDKSGNFIGGDMQPFFVALPVDETKPYFFGEPLFLGRTLIKGNLLKSTAWATDPTAFVAADGLLLYKWDLGNLHAARVLTTPDTIFPLK